MSFLRVIFIAGAIFALDQVSKVFIVKFLDLANRLSIDVLPPFINLRMAWNVGVNFGLFGNQTSFTKIILICISITICCILLFWIKDKKNKRLRFFVALIIGGALGNAFDRVIYGAVADFLNMSCCGIRNPFSFNLADISIFVGAAGLILFSEKDRRIN